MEHGVLLRFCLFILRGFDYGGHCFTITMYMTILVRPDSWQGESILVLLSL